MKKLISHILIALTGMLAVSCNAWLDVTPENAIADDDLFSTGFMVSMIFFPSRSTSNLSIFPLQDWIRLIA